MKESFILYKEKHHNQIRIFNISFLIINDMIFNNDQFVLLLLHYLTQSKLSFTYDEQKHSYHFIHYSFTFACNIS